MERDQEMEGSGEGGDDEKDLRYAMSMYKLSTRNVIIICWKHVLIKELIFFKREKLLLIYIIRILYLLSS